MHYTAYSLKQNSISQINTQDTRQRTKNTGNRAQNTEHITQCTDHSKHDTEHSTQDNEYNFFLESNGKQLRSLNVEAYHVTILFST